MMAAVYWACYRDLTRTHEPGNLNWKGLDCARLLLCQNVCQTVPISSFSYFCISHVLPDQVLHV